jgi:hypothetical protein
MATIAELMVNIKAKDTGVKSTIKSTESRLSKFAKTIKQRYKLIIGVVSAAIAGANLLLINSIRQTAKDIDDLAKTAADRDWET